MSKLFVLYACVAVLSVIGMTNAVLLGIDWITIGYGLNPYIAFPIAVVLGAIAAYASTVCVRESQLA
jgi:hypothetical protein